MGKLVCGICGEKLDVPVHCGKEMGAHNDGKQIVCWMGPACGVQDTPEHCGQVMEIKE